MHFFLLAYIRSCRINQKCNTKLNCHLIVSFIGSRSARTIARLKIYCIWCFDSSCHAGFQNSLHPQPTNQKTNQETALQIMIIDLFTSLPTSLTCNILRDWLNIKSVMTLNSAVCNKLSREMFLKSLQSEEYMVRERVPIRSSSSIFRLLHVIGKNLTSVLFVDRLSHAQRKIVAGHCKNLTHVYCSGKAKMKLRSILRANPSIKHLELTLTRYPYDGTDIPRFEKIPLRNLQSLAVKGYRDVGGQLKYAVLGTNVIHLNLSSSKFHDSTLVRVGQLCPLLRCCGLADTGIKDNPLIEFTQYCPHIAHLDISYNHNVTDIGIHGTMLNLRLLQSLNISSMKNITNTSLQYIHTYCADTLHTLHMYTSRNSSL